MQVMTYSEVRSNLKSVCDRVIDDCDPVAIHRRDGQNVVIMSEEDYNSWKETVYLLANPVNAKRLMESIAQAERGDARAKELMLGDE